MGIIISQSIKSSAVLYLGVVVGAVNRLVLLPNYLTPEQLGFVDALLILGLFLSKISSLGLTGSLIKFYSYFDKQGKSSTFLGGVIITAAIGFLIASLFFLLAQENIFNYFPKNRAILESYYYLIFPLTLAFVVKGLFTNYAAVHLSTAVPVFLNEFILKSTTSVLLLLLGFSYLSFNGYLYSLTSIYLGVGLALIVYCHRFFPIRANLKLKSLPPPDLKKVIRFSLFMVFANLSGYVSQFVDSLMLGSIKGFDVSGIYSIAFFIGLSIEMPKRAISTISLPIIVKHFNENNLPEINKLYKQSSINQGIIGAFLLLLVMVNLDEIFMLLPKSEIYSVGKYVAIFIGLSRLIDMITGCNSEILRASSYYYLDIFLFFLLIVLSVFTNYLLIPIYGLNGAAIASLLSMILYNFVRFILLKKLFNFNPFTTNTIKLIALLTLLTLGNESLPIQAHSTMEALFFLLAKSILFSLLFGFIVFKAKLSDEVNQLITTFKHKVFP